MTTGMGFASRLHDQRDPTGPDIPQEASPETAAVMITRQEIEAELAAFSERVGTDIGEQAVRQGALEKHIGALLARQEVLEKHIHAVTSQQSVTLWMAERNARATALELAIKAIPAPTTAENINPELLIDVAKAFLIWIKESIQ